MSGLTSAAAISDWQLPRSKAPEGWRTPRRFAPFESHRHSSNPYYHPEKFCFPAQTVSRATILVAACRAWLIRG
jgi:hypothetical protein